MEQIESIRPVKQIHELTKGDKVFSLLRLIIGKLTRDDQDLNIERTSILLDTAKGTWVETPTKIIIIESQAEEKDSRLNISIEGSIGAETEIYVPFTLYCSFEPETLSDTLKVDFSGLWSLSLATTLIHQVSPTILHNAVFSLKLYSKTSNGSKYLMGSGRGFLIFGSAVEVAVH